MQLIIDGPSVENFDLPKMNLQPYSGKLLDRQA